MTACRARDLLAESVEKYSIDDPERLYGFDTETIERTRAVDAINRCIDIINEYSRRKTCCEETVLKNSGGVLRLSNVYGVGMANNIFNHIYREFMYQNNMVKINNAFNIRDFIHVSDICSAIIAYIEDIRPGVYNISTGKATSIKDLCDIFARNLKVSKTEYQVESVTEDNTMLVLDSNKFRNRYNWRPKIDIDVGIASWVEDHKRELLNVKQ